MIMESLVVTGLAVESLQGTQACPSLMQSAWIVEGKGHRHVSLR